jgi:hypothetical protein
VDLIVISRGAFGIFYFSFDGLLLFNLCLMYAKGDVGGFSHSGVFILIKPTFVAERWFFYIFFFFLSELCMDD